MLLNKTNIEMALAKMKAKEVDTNNILKEVYAVLKAEDEHFVRIGENIKNGNTSNINKFVFDFLETDNIYHLDHIKKISIDYRLRFLDSKYFKGDIPKEAITKIKQLEKKHNTELKGFKIIAPSKLFKLKDKNDPLLFVPLGNDYFYLIHKWGNDLHPLRKILMWPFKNIVNLTVLVFALSYIITLMVPLSLFSKSNSGFEFWIIYFFMFKSMAAVVIFYGFAKGKNFNHAIWNSKYFNS